MRDIHTILCPELADICRQLRSRMKKRRQVRFAHEAASGGYLRRYQRRFTGT